MPDRRSVLLGLGAVLAAGALAENDYDDPNAMYAALRDQPHQSLHVGGGTIDVTFADGAPAWIASARRNGFVAPRSP